MVNILLLIYHIYRRTLFSTPLGTDAYVNITTWSNPYEFTSSGELGVCSLALLFIINSVLNHFLQATLSLLWFTTEAFILPVTSEQ